MNNPLEIARENFNRILFRKYPGMDREEKFQLRAMFLIHLGILLLTGGVLATSVDESILPVFVWAVFLFNTILLVLIVLGGFNFVRLISFGGLWVGATGLAFGAPLFEHFEIYRLTTHYMAIIFISSTILRQNRDTYILCGLSVVSVWVSYRVRGSLPVVGLGPDLDDYVASSGFILISMIVANTLIGRSSRLLHAARDEARISNERSLEFKELNQRLQVNKRELTALRDYLNSIIDSMPSILISVDENNIVSQWNREATRGTGINEEQALGRNITELLPHMGKQAQMVTEAIEQNRVVTSPPERIVVEDSEPEIVRFQLTTVYPIRSLELNGAVIRIDDVTEQARMQEVIVHTEKMMSVGGLAAGMAHEINNPLGGILQNTGVLKNRLTERMVANQKVADEVGIEFDALQQYLQKRQILKMITMITESGKRAAEIVHNMLSFSRKNETGKTSVTLCGVVKDTIELAKTDYDVNKNYDFKKIEMVLDCISCPPVMCETSKIQQVLLNILRNGAEAMQQGVQSGVIERRPEFRIRVAADAKDEWVSIEVTDNGPGMEESVRKRVFEPFFTTKEVGKGTGLGLSVSYFIVVENHGGHMEVSSQKGQGTTFTVRLPTHT